MKKVFCVLTFLFLFIWMPGVDAGLQLKIGGQQDLYFSGTLNEIDAGTTRSIDGQVFSDYPINSKRAVIAVKSKNDGGDMVVGIFRDDKLIIKSETSAAYGMVTVRINGNEKSSCHFRGAKWRMSPDEVKTSEDWCNLIEDLDLSHEARGLRELKYETVFADTNVAMMYGFLDNKFAFAAYESFFLIAEQEKGMKTFRDHFVALYGKASAQTVNNSKYEVWRDGSTFISLGYKIIDDGPEKKCNATIFYTPRPLADLFKDFGSRMAGKK